MEVSKPDVSYWLIDASLKQGSIEVDRPWLNGDAISIIIAGRLVSSALSPILHFILHIEQTIV